MRTFDERRFAGYVICDLDGCLSDDRGRRHLLPTKENGRRGYSAYHSECESDPVNESVLNDILFDAFDEKSMQMALLVFMTGRDEFMREATERWLMAALPGVEFVALMRPDRDFTPAPALKLRALSAFFEGIHGHPATGWGRVVSAYDDREDVLAAYPIPGSCRQLRSVESEAAPSQPVGVPEILTEMAETFRERNAIYGDNYRLVAPVIRTLFPDGVPGELVLSDRWHLFELLVVKMTRFAAGGFTHIDSVHDAAVYAAMIEADLRRKP